MARTAIRTADPAAIEDFVRSADREISTPERREQTQKMSASTTRNMTKVVVTRPYANANDAVGFEVHQLRGV
jgi:hypothetical protein